MNIEQIFYVVTATITVVLTALTLQRLLSYWWRQYYLLGLVLILGMATIVPSFASLFNSGVWKLSGVQTIYWMLALAAQAGTSLLILQLIYRVNRETPSRSTLVRLLTLASIIAVVVSIVSHFDNRPNIFMASITRDLTFLGALLNMILWRFLMKVRKRDFLLLAVSAGVGIQCSGDAIGHSFRILARQMGSANQIYEFGNILMSLSAVMTIAIWHMAFSRSKYPAIPRAGDESKTMVSGSSTRMAG